MANPDACPIDHKFPTGTAAAVCPVPHDKQQSQQQPATPGVCPVDHKAREAWLAQARTANPNALATPHPISPNATVSQYQSQSQQSPLSSWSQTFWSYVPFTNSSTSSSPSKPPSRPTRPRPSLESTLTDHRQVSTIPRAFTPSPDPFSSSSLRPSNHELESGADPTTGNWVYPSEKMFFSAMTRKGHSATPLDMKTVVPIHNAVNERAWAEIKQWEAPYLGSCGGSKLHSFSGLSTKLTPKARLMTWLGYQAPFDRHDWVVERCGTTVEYVIDFYPGKPRDDGIPSFYLDVRPKLNSFEGVKMRLLRTIGIN